MNRIILTGASSGLGKALAQVFHDHWYEVVGLCRSKPAEFVRWIETDLTSQRSTQRAIQLIRDIYSEFSILIHCAGDADAGEMASIDWEKTEKTFALNMVAPAFMTSSLMDKIRENDADIVGIGATIWFKPYQYFSIYWASKWAFRGWLENLQLELKPTQSRVIGIHPGGMETDGNTKRRDQIVSISWKGNSASFMEPSDIAKFIFQIASLPKSMEVSEVIINRK